jgi:hypothetical protein
LAAFLAKALPGRVIPFLFTARSKSDLGWAWLAAIETGRYKEFASDPVEPLQALFWRQARLCTATVLDGPGKLLRWGVPDGTRDPESGQFAHDDLLISSALCAVLDDQPWGLGESRVVPHRSLFDGMQEVF